MRLTMTFSTVVTTADRSPTVTVLAADVPGDLQLDNRRFVDAIDVGEIELLHVFFPGERVTGIVAGVKAVDSNAKVYMVKYIEDYDTHQEVYMRQT